MPSLAEPWDPLPPTSRRPAVRPRRWRRTAALRELRAETDWGTKHLVMPLFVSAGRPPAGPRGLPGLAARDVEGTISEAARAWDRGVRSTLLFGTPRRKDARGSAAWDRHGPVPTALRGLRERLPDLVRIADVCLCAYTSTGHCGVVREGRVDNDRTLPLLARIAVAYAEAGAEVLAPSAMMDQQVHAIREALDAAGHDDVLVLAYSAKHASAFYQPFRETAGSTPAFGDRRSYQMDPRNRREALQELAHDEAEGADGLMVKPALPCLDLLREARGRFDLPLAAYQVSGEYAMIKAAGRAGWVDEDAAVEETLGAIRRAGADLIVTYFVGELTGRDRSLGRRARG